MKKTILSMLAIALLAVSCSTENDNELTNQTSEIEEIANLVTFTPDEDFDQSSKGKYVGIFGHYTNTELHGKVYINAGNNTKFSALVRLVNGTEFRFKGQAQSRDGNQIYFEGTHGSFNLDIQDYKNPIVTNAYINGEDTESYMVLTKSTKGGDPFLINGTYTQPDDASFFGNWDLIGSGITVSETVSVTPPGFPFPIDVTVFYQEIATVSVSHTGGPTPFTDDNTEPNTATACSPVPVMATNAIIASLDMVNFGISAGGQSSTLNGITSNWSINFTPEITGITPATYVADDCMPAISGVWSWNGRTGTSLLN